MKTLLPFVLLVTIQQALAYSGQVCPVEILQPCRPGDAPFNNAGRNKQRIECTLKLPTHPTAANHKGRLWCSRYVTHANGVRTDTVVDSIHCDDVDCPYPSPHPHAHIHGQDGGSPNCKPTGKLWAGMYQIDQKLRILRMINGVSYCTAAYNYEKLIGHGGQRVCQFTKEPGKCLTLTADCYRRVERFISIYAWEECEDILDCPCKNPIKSNLCRRLVCAKMTVHNVADPFAGSP